jgi:hypothetical protein
VCPVHEHGLCDALELDVHLVAAEKATSVASRNGPVADCLVSRPPSRCSALEQVFSRETWHQRVARTRSRALQPPRGLGWRYEKRNTLSRPLAAQRPRSPARRRGGGGPVPPDLLEELLHVPNVLASVLMRTMASRTGGRPAGADHPGVYCALSSRMSSLSSSACRRCAARR